MPNSKQSGLTPAAGKQKSTPARRSPPAATPISSENFPLYESVMAERALASLERECHESSTREADALALVLAEADRCCANIPDCQGSALGTALRELLDVIKEANDSEKERAEIKRQMAAIAEVSVIRKWAAASERFSESRSAWQEAWGKFAVEVFRDNEYSAFRIQTAKGLKESLGRALNIQPLLVDARTAEYSAWDEIDREKQNQSVGSGPVVEREEKAIGGKGDGNCPAAPPVSAQPELSGTSFSSDQEGRNAYARKLIADIGLNQTDLAKATGMTQSFLSKITTGGGNATIAFVKHLELIRKEIRGGVTSSEQRLISELKGFPEEEQNAVADLTVAYMRRLHEAKTLK